MGVPPPLNLENDASLFKIPEAIDLHSCSFLGAVHNPPESSISVVRLVVSVPLTLYINNLLTGGNGIDRIDTENVFLQTYLKNFP